MKKIYISIFALSAYFFSGCSNDYLEVDQTESISTKDIELFNNDAGAATFVTAIYSKFLDWNMTSFSWIGLSSIASDDADKGSSPGDTGSDKDLMDALTYNASTPSTSEVFAANYEGINRCNQALSIIPQLDKANPALRTRLMGEAKFLRAFMYFTLVKTYGGVPIIDHLPNPSSDEDRIMQLTRKSRAEVYAYIESDLNDAIVALPNKSEYAAAEKGRASKGAAYALLAKINLYQKNWQKVVDNCNLITGYAIVPNYASMFRLAGENDAESIFEIQGTGSVPAKGISGYSNTQGARGNGGWGWGFNTPSQSLVNAYETGDSRKNATIIFRGTTLYDGRVVPVTVENERYNYKAYSSAFTDGWETDVNIKYLRYAEVILMKAEALNELNQTLAAISLLNQIRARAGLSNTIALSQSDVRTAIWKERRVEMAFEHDRFFDLVRTGQAVTAFAIHGKTFVAGKHELFPLPQAFIIQSGGLSTQNPGY
ncbi:RagB/SusD family nutrient uptake outer membrane protein [Flavobacterium sp. LS1P28]|uniref:RagB/SusD family nutrient uptake outer membrane protein n=1 Tax=unclassified Flavobacterium TaxID=196869 RepID=UPI000F83BE31|nr:MULTISPECIES: RagB/SusD family nutrient uptake outer membrane protein [unclassified Flavobacterium]RTY66658.1 RagB/SusD family nutrient uptake outer membrane protein [Flavobacterium sp. LB2P53]RTY73203.1 RagB/SusD family nutrient uptake outer membrane protein [Flavobacterium sp. LS1R10]RTY82438.1 RagB/SusD family nutrient uptake outer membrane protein [Flavobacterium sp. LS1P28]RTY84956.1 RagB/SusD family nutrient uptake outer membrane protein [Flavobacterium sp. ZB4P23]RTY90777.1 RagB/SusD